MDDNTAPRCPLHDVLLYRWPAGDEYICPDPACLLAHGLNAHPGIVNRLAAVHVRWRHGHDTLMPDCVLCDATEDELRAVWFSR